MTFACLPESPGWSFFKLLLFLGINFPLLNEANKNLKYNPSKYLIEDYETCEYDDYSGVTEKSQDYKDRPITTATKYPNPSFLRRRNLRPFNNKILDALAGTFLGSLGKGLNGGGGNGGKQAVQGPVSQPAGPTGGSPASGSSAGGFPLSGLSAGGSPKGGSTTSGLPAGGSPSGEYQAVSSPTDGSPLSGLLAGGSPAAGGLPGGLAGLLGGSPLTSGGNEGSADGAILEDNNEDEDADGSGAGVSGGGKCSGLAQTMLEAHNQKRADHGVPPLTLDEQLNRKAQESADKLGQTGGIAHDPTLGTEIGENIFAGSAGGPTGCDAGKLATDLWYNEINYYDFETGSPTGRGGAMVGHFTQLIWKSSTKMGVGISSGYGPTKIIALYTPRGNVVGQFKENVPYKLG